MEGQKKCTRCRVFLSESHFNRKRNGNLTQQCRECTQQQSSRGNDLYYERNIGLSPRDLEKHIIRQFTDGMTIENTQIDFIVPIDWCSKFNFTWGKRWINMKPVLESGFREEPSYNDLMQILEFSKESDEKLMKEISKIYL